MYQTVGSEDVLFSCDMNSCVSGTMGKQRQTQQDFPPPKKKREAPNVVGFFFFWQVAFPLPAFPRMASFEPTRPHRAPRRPALPGLSQRDPWRGETRWPAAWVAVVKTSGTILGVEVTTHFGTYLVHKIQFGTQFSGWIGMFTGGASWILTHGQVAKAKKTPPPPSPMSAQKWSAPSSIYAKLLKFVNLDQESRRTWHLDLGTNIGKAENGHQKLPLPVER